MKEFWHDLKPVAVIYAIWRFTLLAVEYVSSKFFPLRLTWQGPIPWANFDGVHYLMIAREGYRQYLQAFFPVYPLLVGLFSRLFLVNPILVGLGVSHIATLFGFYFFYKLSKLYDKKNALWSTAILAVYPASLFYAGVYPSGLYFFLATACLYAIEKRTWWWVGVLGLFAGATRIFGVYLMLAAFSEYSLLNQREKKKYVWPLTLMPLGLLVYMFYLWFSVGDPLAFFHQQPLFGAHRTGSGLVMLPQVLWRYTKIFLTAAPTTFIYKVAVFEFLSFLLALALLVTSWRQGLKKSYLVYALAVVITPTLTGTLSSFPRYLHAAFPLFFVLGKLPLAVKWVVILVFGTLLVYFGSAFLSGYFIA